MIGMPMRDQQPIKIVETVKKRRNEAVNHALSDINQDVTEYGGGGVRNENRRGRVSSVRRVVPTRERFQPSGRRRGRKVDSATPAAPTTKFPGERVPCAVDANNEFNHPDLSCLGFVQLTIQLSGPAR